MMSAGDLNMGGSQLPQVPFGRSASLATGTGSSEFGNSVGAFELAVREAAAPSAVSRTANVVELDTRSDLPSVSRVDLVNHAGKTYGELGSQVAASGAAPAASGVANVNVGNNAASHDGRADGVLSGLSRLRSAFDAQAARIADASSKTTIGSEEMMGIQLELVKFSLLVDVASKLTGKSTQVLDTLLKGQ